MGTKIITKNDIYKINNNRIIIRNVSFYANENDIKIILEKKYGSINNIHLPFISIPNNNSDNSKKKQQQHRGFAFVVFDDIESTKKAIEDKYIIIKKRECSMEYSENKNDYQNKKR